jgi:hypothetical protein
MPFDMKVVSIELIRIDKIESVLISQTPFVPKYAIELTQSGPISAPLAAGKPFMKSNKI